MGVFCVRFFQFAFTQFYSRDMSIVASLLMAVMFGGMVFGFTGLYAKKLLSYNLGITNLSNGNIIRNTIGVLIAFLVSFGALSLVIIYGFSSGIARAIDIGDLFRDLSRGRFDEDHYFFFFSVSAPIFLHYMMVVFSSRFRRA